MVRSGSRGWFRFSFDGFSTHSPTPTKRKRDSATNRLFQVSNTAFAAVTLSALYQVAADDGLCNSPYFLQRHPMRTQAYDKI